MFHPRRQGLVIDGNWTRSEAREFDSNHNVELLNASTLKALTFEAFTALPTRRPVTRHHPIAQKFIRRRVGKAVKASKVKALRVEALRSSTLWFESNS